MLNVPKCFRACYSIVGPLHITKKFAIFNQLAPCEIQARRLCSSPVISNQDPLSEYESIYPINRAHFQQLTDGDPVEIKKVRLLQMELAVRAAQTPKFMPRKISFENWRNLLTMSQTSKLKYLRTLCKKEVKSQPEKVVHDETASYNNEDCYEHSIFEHKLFRNALFPMLHINTINAAMNSKLVEGLLFNPTVIMDCGYEKVMNIREMKNLGQQLAVCININKASRRPCKLVLSNLEKESTLGEIVWAAIPNIYDSHVPIITTEQCYTNMYPKEKLVYLTPHCRQAVEYNPEDIYIIGAMVDKTNPGPHSLIKAKAQGIRMGSFPIAKYLIWKSGTKSLTLNQVLSVLLRMAETRDWAHAFSAVPKRKIIDVPIRNFEKKFRNTTFY